MPSAKPRWELEDALRRADSADHLVEDHSAEITPRLDEGMGAQLKADIATLRGVSPDGILAEQRTATAGERGIAADAHDFVMVIRNAVRRSPNGTPQLREAVGVGRDLNEGNTQGILDALASVAAHADALAACRVTAAEITEAASLAAQLQAADAAQKGAMQARTGSTEDRVDVQLRLEATVEAVHVAGMFAFRKRPAIRARFEALVSSGGPSDDDEGGGGPVSGPTT